MHFLIILQVLLSVLSTLSAAIAIHRGRGLEPSQDIALEGPSANAFHSTSPMLHLTIPAKTKKASALPKAIVKRSPAGKQSRSSSAEVPAKGHSPAQVAEKPHQVAAKPHSYAQAANQAAHLSAHVPAKQVGHDHAAKKATELQSGAATSRVTSKTPAAKVGPSSAHAEEKATELAPALEDKTEPPNCGKIPTCRECVEDKRCRYVSKPNAQVCVDKPQTVDGVPGKLDGVPAKSVQHCDYFNHLKMVEDKDRNRITNDLKKHVTRGNGMNGRHVERSFHQFLKSNGHQYTSDPPDRKSFGKVAIIVYPNYRHVGSTSGRTHTTWDDRPGKYTWFSIIQMCEIGAHYSPRASGAVVIPNGLNGLPICVQIVTAEPGASAEEAQAARKTCYPVPKQISPDQPIGSSCED